MSEKKSMLDGEKQYHIQLKEGDIADFVKIGRAHV